MEREDMFRMPHPPSCAKCDKEAITADDAGIPLCARHATIFITLKRMEASNDTPTEPTLAATGS